MVATNERLLTYAEVGELLQMHRNDVGKLVADGKLKAKSRIVRGNGKRPRKFVLLSEALRFMREMPDAPAKVSAPVVSAAPPPARGRQTSQKEVQQWV